MLELEVCQMVVDQLSNEDFARVTLRQRAHRAHELFDQRALLEGVELKLHKKVKNKKYKESDIGS